MIVVVGWALPTKREGDCCARLSKAKNGKNHENGVVVDTSGPEWEMIQPGFDQTIKQGSALNIT